MNFTDMNLSPEINRAISDLGYEEATPIQAKAIPEALTGRDIIGQAQTGTGKTCAFAIPVLERINPEDKHVQALILCPTRELALQVAGEFRKLSKYMHDVKLLPVYGGQDIVKQIRSLKQGVQIVVGTPGRIMDHMRRKTIRCEHIAQVVLDEADEMLDMGFRDDIETILSQVPEDRQTMLFSATMPQPIRELAAHYQHDAENIRIIMLLRGAADLISLGIVERHQRVLRGITADPLSPADSAGTDLRKLHAEDAVDEAAFSHAGPAADHDVGPRDVIAHFFKILFKIEMLVIDGCIIDRSVSVLRHRPPSFHSVWRMDTRD